MRMSAFVVAAIGLLLSATAYAEKQNPKVAGLDYEQFVALPYNVQTDYLNAIRDVLVEMDSKGRKSHASFNWMIDQLICIASAADSSRTFCINLGVVQETKDCPQPPDGFDDFNTSDYFKKIGLIGATDTACPGGVTGDIPCSPFFGFTSQGNLYCTHDDRTRSCESISKKDKANSHPLSEIIKACATTAKSEPAKIDCKKLPDFLDHQSALTTQFCHRESSLACGRLVRQMDRVLAATKEIEKSENGLVDKIDNYLNQANSGNLGAPSKPDCPPSTPPAKTQSATIPKMKVDATQIAVASAPQSPPAPVVKSAPQATTVTAPVAAVSGNNSPRPLTPPGLVDNVACNVKYPLKNVKDQDLNRLIEDGFSNTKPTSKLPADRCVQYTTPEGTVLTLYKNPMGTVTTGLVQLPADKDGKIPPPISLDRTSILIMKSLSNALEYDNTKISVEPDQLLKSILPATPIVRSSAPVIYNHTNLDGLEYETSDGTVIRYAIQDPATGYQAINIKLNGQSDFSQMNFPAEGSSRKIASPGNN